MAFPLSIYIPIRRGPGAQICARIFHLFFRSSSKPAADTGLIHFSRVVLVPNSANNKGRRFIFKRVRAAMLITTFDGGMSPYFLAFWRSKRIRTIFKLTRLFAVNPPPKTTGDEYTDYSNFTTWLMDQNIVTEAFYNAYPQTLLQIQNKFPNPDLSVQQVSPQKDH